MKRKKEVQITAADVAAGALNSSKDREWQARAEKLFAAVLSHLPPDRLLMIYREVYGSAEHYDRSDTVFVSGARLTGREAFPGEGRFSGGV
jgi:hypothetical protein